MSEPELLEQNNTWVAIAVQRNRIWSARGSYNISNINPATITVEPIYAQLVLNAPAPVTWQWQINRRPWSNNPEDNEEGWENIDDYYASGEFFAPDQWKMTHPLCYQDYNPFDEEILDDLGGGTITIPAEGRLPNGIVVPAGTRTGPKLLCTNIPTCFWVPKVTRDAPYFGRNRYRCVWNILKTPEPQQPAHWPNFLTPPPGFKLDCPDDFPFHWDPQRCRGSCRHND